MSVLSLVAALQLTVALTAPDTVNARTPFTITLEVGTVAGRTIRIEPPRFAPFTTLKVARLVGRDSTGPAARAARRVWERHETRFTLQAPTAGRFGFSPFVIRADATVMRSRALAFVVQDVAPPAPRARVLTSAPVNPARPVDVHAVASADTVWRGQQVTYSVGVFLDDFARTRLRRNPEFVPPEVRGALSYPLRGTGRATFSRTVGGKNYSAYVFERALFPVAAGELRIPAARLTYALPQGPGYFSR
ncbi:MAG: BatD family protein, partial [Gemmatimonadaceae bacterium]|nr:BatD family protein [Gemmatimonadaceae bacterium]